MIGYSEKGKVNTEKTIACAVEKALELQCDIVLASSTGSSAGHVIEACSEMGFDHRIIVVRTASTASSDGENAMNDNVKQSLEDAGVVVVTAAHALSAGERSISTKFHGSYPLEIIAAALRTFGQGTKVAFECAVMALDADEIKYQKPVVAMGGSGRGLDTAIVITPSYASTLLESKVHQIICKPLYLPDLH